MAEKKPLRALRSFFRDSVVYVTLVSALSLELMAGPHLHAVIKKILPACRVCQCVFV